MSFVGYPDKVMFYDISNKTWTRLCDTYVSFYFSYIDMYEKIEGLYSVCRLFSR